MVDGENVPLIVKIGKTYIVSASYKKSLLEIERFKDEGGREVSIETWWRNGCYTVKVKNQVEADLLQKCIGNYSSVWSSEDYDDLELDHTSDGCMEEFTFNEETWPREEEMENLSEEFEANLVGEEWLTRFEWLERKGFESLGCRYEIHNGIDVEEEIKQGAS
eukprot:g5693.t1